MRICRLAVLLALWVGLLTGATMAAGRVALVMGNSAYPGVGNLANPVNDAADLAASLTRIGFEVTLESDLTYEQMRLALREFGPKAGEAEMALVYFGGHGIEVDQQNYVIPTDAALQSARDIPFEAVPLDLLIQTVSSAQSLRMVIVDACRNNPFIAQMQKANRSVGRGLTRTEPVGGTLVAYSAKAGTVASDGVGRNSPFMKGLLAHIEQPGLDVSLLFRKVRDSVLASTDNQQEPFTYGSLPGDEVYLVPPVKVAEPEVAPPSSTAGTPEEEFAWSLVRSTRDVGQVQSFLFTFPKGLHVPDAIALMRELSQSQQAAAAPEPATAAAVEETVAPPPVENDATATSPATPDVPAGPELEGAALVIAIQTELQRIDCGPGQIDGQWGPQSRAAMMRFIRAVDLGLLDALNALKPTTYMLNLLRAQRVKCTGGVAEASPAVLPSLTSTRCAIIGVVASDRGPSGASWDEGAGSKPDINIAENITHRSRLCLNSQSCQMRIETASRALSLSIIDDDGLGPDVSMAQGGCDIGSTCTFPYATVVVSSC